MRSFYKKSLIYVSRLGFLLNFPYQLVPRSVCDYQVLEFQKSLKRIPSPFQIVVSPANGGMELNGSGRDMTERDRTVEVIN